ncbi:hypothetical protein PGC26_24085, partial [Enterobacter cloacae subsp. dissolvens]|nr:hypothetical protein [Enterobacter cloacae subsp. dissolvens]
MTTAALAAAVNRNARDMVSVMMAFERLGVVIKNGQGKGVTWSLPVTCLTETDSTEAVHTVRGSKSRTEFSGDIAAFTARPDDLIIPYSRFI